MIVNSLEPDITVKQYHKCQTFFQIFVNKKTTKIFSKTAVFPERAWNR